MQLNLSTYRYNHYSQMGEDGVIEKLFEIMQVNSGYLVEMGAWDGKHLSNTRFHYEKNNDFNLLLIEPVEERYDKIERNDNTIALNICVDVDGENDLNNIFDRHNVTDIALLSIDVDGPDLEIWLSLDKEKYRPAIVIIEFVEWQQSDRLDYLVSCFSGYELVCVTGNFIFVRSDFGIQSKHTIHELIASAGFLDYDLYFGIIRPREYDAFVNINGLNLDRALFAKLAGPQNIIY